MEAPIQRAVAVFRRGALYLTLITVEGSLYHEPTQTLALGGRQAFQAVFPFRLFRILTTVCVRVSHSELSYYAVEPS